MYGWDWDILVVLVIPVCLAALMIMCAVIVAFDEFGTDTEQSDQIWSLLVKTPNL